jgi:hypothetical protein
MVAVPPEVVTVTALLPVVALAGVTAVRIVEATQHNLSRGDTADGDRSPSLEVRTPDGQAVPPLVGPEAGVTLVIIGGGSVVPPSVIVTVALLGVPTV